MILCRVIGNAIATVKHPVFDEYAVMVCQPVDVHGNPRGRSFLSVDSVQAGVGDLVLCAREGNTARQILAKPPMAEVPHHSVILAIVDEVELGGAATLTGPGE
jgi:microcompartment protein CcmK/EutM